MLMKTHVVLGPSFRTLYEADVARGIDRVAPQRPVTESDLLRLPPLVRKYLQRVGVVSAPRVRSMRLHFAVDIKRSHDAPWMCARAEQTNFYDEPTRLFLMDASLMGVPFQAFHRYVGAHATMQVRVASRFEIVDARGPEMDQSETVTLFNDMCVMAPATLVDAPIAWEPIDPRTVHARFTNAGHTIAADLSFDGDGDLVGFVSNDRYQSADGEVYLRYPWSTPLRDYRDFHGTRLASHGDAIWKEPRGDFLYGRFDILNVEYNFELRGDFRGEIDRAESVREARER
jgi:hypothetical protein